MFKRRRATVDFKVHVACTAALNLSALTLGQFKMGGRGGHFEVALQLTCIHSEYYTVFFFSITSNDQNCKSNQLYLF